MQVWVLTGDKLETAVNISFSCGHFKRSMIPLELTGAANEEIASELMQGVKYVLIFK